MKRIFVIAIVLLICSCEGNKSGEGIIFDRETNLPLDSVAYKDLASERVEAVQFTDSTGIYHISGVFTGCVPDCPDYMGEFKKTGYKRLLVQNPNGIIYLDRE